MGKKITRITDSGTIAQGVYADSASVNRVAESGLDLKILGALGSAVRVGKGAVVRVFNAGVAVAYVAFGPETVAAPTGPTNGIPVPAGQYLVLNSGDCQWVIASAATVYGYQGDAS